MTCEYVLILCMNVLLFSCKVLLLGCLFLPLILQLVVYPADSASTAGTELNREETDARSIFVGNVCILFCHLGSSALCLLVLKPHIVKLSAGFVGQVV